MLIENFDVKKKVFIIAEIGNNHEGNFKLAKKMIEQAAIAGVNAVKFQLFKPEHISGGDLSRLKKLKNFSLSIQEFKKLSTVAKKNDLIFFSTPFDLESAKFLNTIQNVFKVSSGDNNFYPLISSILKFKKPTIISTGCANIKILKKTYDLIKKSWSKKNFLSKLAFLHCVSSYPVPNDQANLASIPYLKKKFPKITIGYSDHTLGIDAAILSVTAGARIIEKHFTLDKGYSDYRDHNLSANPKEMNIMVKKIREVEKMFGKEEKKILTCEKEMSFSGRRSIAASRNLREGSTLKYSDLVWIRPGKGYAPGDEYKLIGRKIKKNIKINQVFQKDDFK